MEVTGWPLTFLMATLQENKRLLFIFPPPELQVGTRQKELLDIDSSSVILEDGITKLNTIGHYEVRARVSPIPRGTRLCPVPRRCLPSITGAHGHSPERCAGGFIAGTGVFLRCSFGRTRELLSLVVSWVPHTPSPIPLIFM